MSPNKVLLQGTMEQDSVTYPAIHDLDLLSEEAISLKIARHSTCSLCDCDGLKPETELKVYLKTEESSSDFEDCPLLNTCLCTHGVPEHGNPVNDANANERIRRAKVAVRLDELLDDVDKLLDFTYTDEDVTSLRKQMCFTDRLPIHTTNSDGEDDQPLATFISPSIIQNGKPHEATPFQNGASTHLREQRSAFASKPPPRSSGESSNSRPEKPCIGELRKGIIRVISVDLDHTPRSLIVLCGLKTLFRKQLPKMPPEYIARLVYDHNSRALAIVKAGWKVVGGILFRPFPHRGFAEIVFFATASIDQIKGYGAMLMNHFKMHIKNTYPGMMYFLTYADNYAVRFFKKQGFSEDITLDRSIWAGYIKDYEGATILQCSLLPKVDYTRVRELLSSQREAILHRIYLNSTSHRIHPAPMFTSTMEGSIEPMDPGDVPGLKETGWTIDMARQNSNVRPDQAVMQQLLISLQSHPQAWAFLQPVNGEEVTDYYDVIKKPMDFNTMEHKLNHNLYENLNAFLDDARLVFQNCLIYNPEGSVYAKNATTLQKFLDEQVAANTIPHTQLKE